LHRDRNVAWPDAERLAGNIRGHRAPGALDLSLLQLIVRVAWECFPPFTKTPLGHREDSERGDAAHPSCTTRLTPPRTEHTAALGVYRAHGVGKKHDCQHEQGAVLPIAFSAMPPT